MAARGEREKMPGFGFALVFGSAVVESKLSLIKTREAGTREEVVGSWSWRLPGRLPPPHPVSPTNRFRVSVKGRVGN